MTSVDGIGSLPPAGVDPNTYAQQYATENGISLEAAKAQLKAKYGDPQKPILDGSSQDTSSSVDLSQAGDQPKDPNEVLKTYATEKGLTLDEAKEQLKAKYGDPQKNAQGTGPAENSPQGGAPTAPPNGAQPKDPDEFLKTYATENGLTLDAAKAILKEKYGAPKAKADTPKLFELINKSISVSDGSDEDSRYTTEFKALLESYEIEKTGDYDDDLAALTKAIAAEESNPFKS